MSGPSEKERTARALARAVEASRRCREEASAACKRKHTKCPEGYLEWHAWAERKAKTHRAVMCPGCGLWKIWMPKTKRGAT